MPSIVSFFSFRWAVARNVTPIQCCFEVVAQMCLLRESERETPLLCNESTKALQEGKAGGVGLWKVESTSGFVFRTRECVGVRQKSSAWCWAVLRAALRERRSQLTFTHKYLLWLMVVGEKCRSAAIVSSIVDVRRGECYRSCSLDLPAGWSRMWWFLQLYEACFVLKQVGSFIFRENWRVLKVSYFFIYCFIILFTST